MSTVSVLIDARGTGEEATGIGRYVTRLLQEFAVICPSVRPLVRPSQYRMMRKSGLRPVALLPDRLRVPVPTPNCSVAHGPDFLTPPVRARHHVITVHDLAFIRFPHLYPDGFSTSMEERLGDELKKVDAVICDSASTSDDVVHFFNIDRSMLRIIHLGTDMTARSGKERPASLHRPYLLHSGAMVPRKNLPRLLDAYRLLRVSLGVDVDLVLTGSKALGWASDWPRIDMWLRDNPTLAPAVHVVGYLDQESLHATLAHAEAYVSASVWEGFGLPILDALAAGTPVVCLRGGAIPEFAGDIPFYAEDDAESLAHSMAEAVVDSASRRIKRQDGQRLATSFTWRQTAEKTCQVYRDLARSGRLA